jgi:uncharacterized membrane protein
MSPKASSVRLKIGIGLVIIGLILQVFLEVNRTQEKIRNSGALYSCAMYGCDEYTRSSLEVSSNPIGWLVLFLGYTIIMGHFSGLIAFKKGRDYNNYFWLGFLLGFIGLIIVALMGNQNPTKVKIIQEYSDEDQKKCKYCAELIKKEAIFCKHCKNNLD